MTLIPLPDLKVGDPVPAMTYCRTAPICCATHPDATLWTGQRCCLHYGHRGGHVSWHVLGSTITHAWQGVPA